MNNPTCQNRQQNEDLHTRRMDSGNTCKLCFELSWSSHAQVSSQCPLLTRSPKDKRDEFISAATATIATEFRTAHFAPRCRRIDYTRLNLLCTRRCNRTKRHAKSEALPPHQLSKLHCRRNPKHLPTPVRKNKGGGPRRVGPTSRTGLQSSGLERHPLPRPPARHIG